MNKETLRILVAVLRVFVDAVNKGHDSTLHAQEVTNQVCRAFQRRKEKEKKNTHGYVVTALRALKAKRILFESIDNWDDDRLKRPKASEQRRAFGLTRPALDYLTGNDRLIGYSVRSDIVLTDMLAEFGVVAAPASSTTVPAVLVETIQAIEQKEEIMSVEPVSADHNARRLAAEVQNIKFISESTPVKLLGILRGLNAVSADTSASANDIGWEPHKIQNASQPLADRGLVTWRMEVPFHPKNRAATTKRIGIYLTDLGQRVAAAGNFRSAPPPDEQRWSYAQQKQGTMLKDSKKSTQIAPPVANGGQITLTLPDGTTGTFPDVATAMEFYQTRPRAKNAAGEEPPPPQKTLGLYETIMGFVVDATRAMALSLDRLSQADLPNGEKAEKIDPQFLSFAVTQLTYVLHDLKYELADVIHAAEKTGSIPELDMKRLQDYFAGIELAGEEIMRGRKRVIPSLRPHPRATLPVVIKLPTNKNITPEYVGPHPTRPAVVPDAAPAADEG